MGSSSPETWGTASKAVSFFLSSTMEAIKKKMQAMKVEKDNACDRVDVCEEQCKAARLRASKAEGEVEELTNKARQLETELDLTKENLGIATLKLDKKEKQLSATELEMNALNRRVSSLEEDLEKTEEKMLAAASKLDKASTACDDSERAKKVFQSKAEERADVGETKIIELEEELKVVANNLKSPPVTSGCWPVYCFPLHRPPQVLLSAHSPCRLL